MVNLSFAFHPAPVPLHTWQLMRRGGMVQIRLWGYLHGVWLRGADHVLQVAQGVRDPSKVSETGPLWEGS